MLSREEYVRWRSVVKNGSDNAPALATNAVEFLESLDSKFDRYKQQTFLSDKQEAWLIKIEEDLVESLGDHYETWEE